MVVNKKPIDQPDWENPGVFSINKEEPKAHFFHYESEDLVLSGNPEKSHYYQSLNGQWKFHYALNPESRPLDFMKREFDVTQWDDIDVPGSWEMQNLAIEKFVKHGGFIVGIEKHIMTYAKGAKRYRILPAGGTALLIIEERFIKQVKRTT